MINETTNKSLRIPFFENCIKLFQAVGLSQALACSVVRNAMVHLEIGNLQMQVDDREANCF